MISATAATVIKALITLAVGIGYCGGLLVRGARTGIVAADETFILESQGPAVGPPRGQPRKRGGKAKHPGLFSENIPILVGRDREGATFDAALPQVDRASIAEALDGVVTPANPFVCDGGKAIVAFVRKAKIPVNVVPAPGKPAPKPSRHGTTKPLRKTGSSAPSESDRINS